ncbi:conserved hypothetical protein [Frankia sp. Hr75.2]|nr:conserved hypothetical protein [Frankia sp. Hr75.2]
MKPLSEQLSELSKRARKVDDVVGAARERNRAQLEAQRDELKSAVEAGRADAAKDLAAEKADVREDVAEARASMKARWDAVRSSIDQRFAEMRADADERRQERDIGKAQHHADMAERDAADAIDLALFVLDEADYAIIDAVIAREDAEQLAKSR